jgi:hypothetical protein
MSEQVTLVASRTHAAGGAPLACLALMRCIEVDTGRWRIELGGGAGIEIVLLFSRTLAFFCYCGGLVMEMPVGES